MNHVLCSGAVRLRYSATELMAEHEYAQPHVVAGRRLHGGFDANGIYVSPRTLYRWQAVDAWTAALRARGGEPLRSDSSLLAGVRMPNTRQQKLLLQCGLGQTFWNTLTITGVIEARGQVLAQIPIPDFQPVVDQDLSELALGHLGAGLLRAHGLDEGGDASAGLGGHDAMWFVLRDLAFGATDYPQPEIPTAITRPETGDPLPELARPQARMLAFLMQLLLIELRAEIGFSSTEALLSDPELFQDRRREAAEAAEMVGRIRQDEAVHLASLRVALGEARELSFHTLDGGRIAGAQLIDPFWQSLVHWATVEQPKLAAQRTRAELERRIRAHPQGETLLREFDALAA